MVNLYKENTLLKTVNLFLSKALYPSVLTIIHVLIIYGTTFNYIFYVFGKRFGNYS